MNTARPVKAMLPDAMLWHVKAMVASFRFWPVATRVSLDMTVGRNCHCGLVRLGRMSARDPPDAPDETRLW